MVPAAFRRPMIPQTTPISPTASEPAHKNATPMTARMMSGPIPWGSSSRKRLSRRYAAPCTIPAISMMPPSRKGSTPATWEGKKMQRAPTSKNEADGILLICFMVSPFCMGRRARDRSCPRRPAKVERCPTFSIATNRCFVIRFRSGDGKESGRFLGN